MNDTTINKYLNSVDVVCLHCTYNTSKECNKYTEDQAEKLLTYLIFREIVKFVDYSKYPLNFYY